MDDTLANFTLLRECIHALPQHNYETLFYGRSLSDLNCIYQVPRLQNVSNFFEFEADFVASLRCIPMQIRFKLDTCGVKLKLSHWHQFSQVERQTLIEHPCTTEDELQSYRDLLQKLVIDHTGHPAGELPIDDLPAWLEAATIPIEVQAKAEAMGVAIAPVQWATLTPLQRFALIKLSRPSHENKNFLPALQEFRLA
ncbi:MAG: nitrate reductase maturation protein NarM [Cyanothece sp. SIO1E1]|nr:nitrate reductase maturation protein NarM [Cyanothece sp. SIO1E1]